MDEAIIDVMLEECRACLVWDSEQTLQRLKAKPESPIERAIVIALTAINMIWKHKLVHFEDPPQDKRGQWVLVKPQAKIGSYRVDFLLETHEDDRLIRSTVAECDGHQFHERTKEQAARDRSRDRTLTLKGYQVVRFTGSEIYNTPAHCVTDLLRVALNMGADEG